MEILKKLAQLANDLDSRGFHQEANMIDEILKEAAGMDFSGQPGQTPADVGSGMDFSGTDPFPEGATKYVFPGREEKRVGDVNTIRQALGLGPGGFDRQTVMLLKEHYPQVFEYVKSELARGGRPVARQILSLMQNQPGKMDFAGQTGETEMMI